MSKTIKIVIREVNKCYIRPPFYKMFKALAEPFKCANLVEAKEIFLYINKTYGEKSLIKLLDGNGYHFFNALQSIHNLNFRLSHQSLSKIKREGYAIERFAPNINIYWNKKAVAVLQYGNLPNLSKAAIIEKFATQDKKIVNLIWSANGYKVLSPERLEFIKKYK